MPVKTCKVMGEVDSPDASAAWTFASVAVWMMVEMVSLAVQVSSKSVTNMPIRPGVVATC